MKNGNLEMFKLHNFVLNRNFLTEKLSGDVFALIDPPRQKLRNEANIVAIIYFVVLPNLLVACRKTTKQFHTICPPFPSRFEKLGWRLRVESVGPT